MLFFFIVAYRRIIDNTLHKRPIIVLCAAAQKRPDQSRIDCMKTVTPSAIEVESCNLTIHVWCAGGGRRSSFSSTLTNHLDPIWGLWSPPCQPGLMLGNTQDVWAHTNARWAGGNTWCPARSLSPTVWLRWLCHQASCSLFQLCVLLSPHRSVLQEGEEVGGGSSNAEGPPPPFCSVQSQRSSAGSRCCSLSPYRLCRLQVQS